jgi:murein L,D-transpeptidase YafK
MKYSCILSFFLALVLMAACQVPSENSIKKEVQNLSNIDSILAANEGAVLIEDRSGRSIYGDLPDSIIAEIKLMDSLLGEADEEILAAAAEESALEKEYLEQVNALDTVSLKDWKFLPPKAFKRQQLSFENVRMTYEHKLKHVQQLLSIKGIHSFNINFYLRAFKEESILELWVKPKEETQYTLITTYHFFQGISLLGPKQRRGDHQVPEGIYAVDYFNPESLFRISLCLNYPNAADVIRNGRGTDLGDAICIHGNEVSVGCLAITDLRIPTVYILAVEAKDKGQEQIPIHIFPARLTNEKLEELERLYVGNTDFIRLWNSMKPLYAYFEKEQQLPIIKTTSQGFYQIGIP